MADYASEYRKTYILKEGESQYELRIMKSYGGSIHVEKYEDRRVVDTHVYCPEDAEILFRGLSVVLDKK
jgi:hypothetical protein